MTVAEFVSFAKQRLLRAPHLQCADPLLHAKQMVEAILRVDATKVYLRWNSDLSDEETQNLEGVLERRLNGEPFQYIVRKEGFWKQDFSVGPGVLIPRRETEMLVEKFLEEAKPNESVAELGAGSGNIGLSIVGEMPGIKWHAFEKSTHALKYLEENRSTLLPESGNYQIHAGDFFEMAPAFAPYDWIVSNPPYVDADEMRNLPIEVTQEPELALFGGEDGLGIIRHMIASHQSLLVPGGGLLFEIGSRQQEAVHSLLQEARFENIEFIKDYAGLPRVAFCRTTKEGMPHGRVSH